ncbi:hypothetical protein VSS37_07005 [Candidatus Thiothrix sp. Deng01]|uniref:Uncharacterized protein n=1 Tax=Candidatus Thiothrix phosphatis TaxID=3112415 RepID=A0ABU6CXA2_9GAMM|nr:hypothetical protein [Candidatus Thiothrix sp. Deng01]MEB4590722.1 hypothetical protein [Candidatus Thiothrix sp. Deng01]
MLHSHNYQRSDYCRKELQWFLQHNQRARNGVMVGNASRLFNVLLNNIPHPQWPQELQGLVGFRLHDEPDKSGQFGYPLTLQDAAFGKAVLSLVEAAARTMEALNQLQPTPAPEVGGDPPDERRPKVFLADVADTLQPFRRHLITEIGDKAIILPALPPPYDASEHNQKLADTLEQASLCIHLLDQWGGRVMDGMDGMTFPRMQAGMARGRATPRWCGFLTPFWRRILKMNSKPHGCMKWSMASVRPAVSISCAVRGRRSLTRSCRSWNGLRRRRRRAAILPGS